MDTELWFVQSLVVSGSIVPYLIVDLGHFIPCSHRNILLGTIIVSASKNS